VERSEPPRRSNPRRGSSLLDLIAIEALPGTIRPPVDDRHVIDLHVGAPAEAAVRLDGRVRREPQIQGMFTVIPAGASGTWVFSRRVQALLLRLSPSLVRETAAATATGGGSGELVPSINVRDPHVEQLALLVRAEYEAGYPSGQLYSDSLAAALAARLVAAHGRGAAVAPRHGLPARRLRDVVDHIEAHLEHDLGLEALAQVAGYSASHFKALFKRATGTPVHRYVIERRVERARALLLTGEHSMTDIAALSGFAHHSHMTRCVRRVLGLTPRQILEP
jgi:AraC family transcriptional regulator